MPVELLSCASQLPAADWQALETADDPFVSQAFLGLAEETGAAGEALSWRAMHCVLRDATGHIQGLLPLYLRHHSFGDFSHDWQWAAAWRQAGLAYYPKLVTAVPYTPSPGPRLLLARQADAAVAADLVATAIELVRETGASAWQCLYAYETDLDPLRAAGLILRRGVQFHWLNRGYRDFADFLDTLTADRRKKIKREQRAVAEAGLRVEVRHGDALDAELWAAVHGHYRDTFLRHGNHPAFSAAFFQRVGQVLGPRMVVFIAWQGERAAASAICYRNETTLFGRHWGTSIECPGLHFDLCYYRGIEYAIADGLQRFEPGAGGEHKLARGFEPVSTWSAFWIADVRMRGLLARHLAREEAAVLDYQAELARHLPYKAGG
jgi:predicted N-acyltransferase